MDFPPKLNGRLLFGAAYYDEYRRVGSLDADLDLMVNAGFSVIRVGESVWSTWEPRQGEYELEWLLQVLDGAHVRGIDVIIGTPTYAIPPWLQKLHPEIAAEVADGHIVGWGGRQEIDYLNAHFREHAEGVIRQQIGRYASHPAVIGFQVDNEPGLYLLHNRDVFDGFVEYLKSKYGTVDHLNQEWNLTFWSHRLAEWDELWTPNGNRSPQYQLEWRRYQAKVVTDFVSWQAEIVRDYATPDQFVTTCISYERPAIDDVAIVAALGVTAGNPYYKMQDGLRMGVDVARPELWWSSGVWGLVQQGDRMFSTAQAPFLVTETNAQTIGQSQWQNHPPYPGQIGLAAMSLVARGSKMIEYWQWHTMNSGIETYWGGVIPHSGVPGRIYREIAQLGAALRDIEPMMVDYVPDYDVTFLYSTDTKWAYQFDPPLAASDGGPNRDSYLDIFDSFYRGAFEAGVQVRMLHPDQLLDLHVAELVRAHPILVVPSQYVASTALLERLAEYANRGGHLIAGIRTGYGDDLARARAVVAPGALATVAGITYEEYSNIDTSLPVNAVGLALDEANVTGWMDGIELNGAEALVTYQEGIYAGRPAVTTHQTGDGRVTYVGTVPDRALARALFRWAVDEPWSGSWKTSDGLTIASGSTPSSRIWFISNWSPDEGWATPSFEPQHVEKPIGIGETLKLAPWTYRVIVEARGSTTAPDPSNADAPLEKAGA